MRQGFVTTEGTVTPVKVTGLVLLPAAITLEALIKVTPQVGVGVFVLVGVLVTVEVDVQVGVVEKVGEKVLVKANGVSVKVAVDEPVGVPVEVLVLVGVELGNGVIVPSRGEYQASLNLATVPRPPKTQIWLLWDKASKVLRAL